MNREKRLYISPWRKRFSVFLQRQRSIVAGLSGLIRWNDSFRKRLENIYFSSMTHRIESRSLLRNRSFVLRFPFVFRNPLKSLIYEKSRLYGDKGINAYQGGSIRFYPLVVFQRYTNSIEGGINSANDSRLPIIRQRREIFDPPQILFLYTVQNAALNGSKGILSFARTGLKPVSDRGTTLSIKSYQRSALKSQNKNMNHGIYKQNEQYDRPGSGPVEDLISAPGGSGADMDELYEDKAHKHPGMPDDHNPSEVSGNFLIKPGDLNLKYKDEALHLRYKESKGKFTELKGRLSLSHTRRTLIVTKDIVRSMKPYKRTVIESSHRDLKYGDSLNDRVYYGGAGSLTSDPHRFISNMGQININNRSDYPGGTENLNPHEAPETIRPYIHDGLKPFRQKHMPVVPSRNERADSIQADTVYAIPPFTRNETKSAGGRFSSILTSDITREFSRPQSLTSQNERSLYNIARTKDPFGEKKDTGKTGASIDYNKLADRVYEILMRRIIREKERMGELI
ncbi:MAG: hypothetical protein ACMUHX_02325 [bacterium]